MGYNPTRIPHEVRYVYDVEPLGPSDGNCDSYRLRGLDARNSDSYSPKPYSSKAREHF